MIRYFLPLEEKPEKGRRTISTREKQDLWVSITPETRAVGDHLWCGASHTVDAHEYLFN